MLHFSSVAVILGFLCLAVSMLVFAAVKRKPLAAYYSGVYPLATSSVPSDWLSRRARFLYKEASKLPQVLAAFGSRPLNSFQQSPELGDWWAPVWFPEGARMKNEYPPNAWWAVVPELERELRAQNGFLEVTHVPDDLQRVYKVHGIWFYAARGSGVFLETGRSLLAHNKLQALSFLGMSWREMARRFGRGSYMYSPGRSASFGDLASGKVDPEISFPGEDDEERIARLFEFAVSIGSRQTEWRRFPVSKLYQIDRVQNSAVFDGEIAARARNRGYDSVHMICQANGEGGWTHEIVFVRRQSKSDSSRESSGLTVDEKSLEDVADRLFVADPLDPSRRQACRFLNNDDYRCLACLQQTANRSCRKGLLPPPPPPYYATA